MFDEICKKIISPPKFKYSLYDLGASLTKWGKRTDFNIFNLKNHKMSCSLYEPHNIQFQRACVVYLHSMNGSRLQGSVYVQKILKEGVSFCTFDFSGCGNSDGDKITFGANQKYDIQVVIHKLKQTFFLNRFILWGRSMGSVSAIKYSELIYDKSKTFLSYQNEEIVALILDSSFKSFSKLLVQIGHTQSQIPTFIIKAGFFMIKNTLETNGDFKISDLDLISDSQSKTVEERTPLEKIQTLNLPILFLVSKQDKTVSYQHSIDMFTAYKSKFKQLKFFKGLHNQSRQEDYLFQIVTFINKILKNQKKQIDSSEEKIILQTKIDTLLLKQNNSNTINSKNKPVTRRSSLINLIEQNHMNQIQEHPTLLQLENIESGCMCTMFENEFAKTDGKYPYKDRSISSHFKQPTYCLSNNKLNFNCDQLNSKQQDHHTKMKKSITDFSSQPNLKSMPIHGPNLSKTNPNIHYFTQQIQINSPKTFKQFESKFDQNVCLPLKKLQDKKEKITFNNGDNTVFDELYKPLKVSSQSSLKIPLKQSYKRQ